MFGIGYMELLIIGAVFLLLVAPILILVAVGVLGFIRFGDIRRGHATLNCPHCGVETRTNEGKCGACGKALA
jgi:hypothetical protein